MIIEKGTEEMGSTVPCESRPLCQRFRCCARESPTYCYEVGKSPTSENKCMHLPSIPSTDRRQALSDLVVGQSSVRIQGGCEGQGKHFSSVVVKRLLFVSGSLPSFIHCWVSGGTFDCLAEGSFSLAVPES